MIENKSFSIITNLMKILLLGANGQLGKTLIQSKPEKINLISLSKNEFNFLKINDCLEIINEINPSIIINAVAYTNVDKAESENEIVKKINADVPYKIASESKKLGSKFLHISTDFVFDGSKSQPYRTNDEVNPLSIYGKSKALGEKLLIELNNTKIIRTSWLYSPFGKNFCLTMLNLIEKFYQDKKPLKVIYDQVSCPTSTFTLSNLCWKLLIKPTGIIENNRIIHWSDAGVASWYDFAVAIGEIGLQENLISGMPDIFPIKSKDFPSIAKRPNFSLLDCDQICNLLKIKRNHWKFELSNVIKKIDSKIK